MNTKLKEVSIFPDGRVDVNNAAAYVGLSVKTLAMKRSKGVGPKFIKRGRVFYWSTTAAGSPQTPRSAPGIDSTGSGRRPPTHPRSLGQRQVPRACRPRRALAPVQPGYQADSPGLLQHHPGELPASLDLHEGGSPRGGGVEVLHFYELCSKLLGDQVPYEKETPEYYDYIVKAAGELVATSDLRYDAILVDEGQDYSDEMYLILMGLLNPLTNHLVIAIDESQTIYGVRQTWKQVGIKAGGRVKSLRWVYRNTEEIASFANRFMGSKETSEGEPLPQLELPGTHFRDHGPHPELVQVVSLEHESSLVADRIAALVQEGIPASEIAVLYTTSQAPVCALPLPKLIERDLAARGVLSRWASEDYRAKRSYDITSDSVTVSTIHSVKGMDFAFVFLVGIDCLTPGRWTAEQLKNLVYVGITRARHGLMIPYATENDLVRDLKVAL